jgi:hypothetical protein
MIGTTITMATTAAEATTAAGGMDAVEDHFMSAWGN